MQQAPPRDDNDNIVDEFMKRLNVKVELQN